MPIPIEFYWMFALIFNSFLSVNLLDFHLFVNGCTFGKVNGAHAPIDWMKFGFDIPLNSNFEFVVVLITTIPPYAKQISFYVTFDLVCA